MPECIDDKGPQGHPHFSIEIEKNGSGLGKKKKKLILVSWVAT